jgi:hypothetical protein
MYYNSVLKTILGAVHLFHHKRTERTLFHNPLSPLKVYKSSEKNDDGGRFHEIKHADPSRGRTGDRTFRAGSLGGHEHTTCS